MSSTSQAAFPVAQAFSSSSVRAPLDGKDASLIWVIAEPSVSLYPQSEEAVQPTYATSSVTVAESPAEVGASFTALTVIDTWSVALSSSPSLAVKESTALLLLFA